MRREPVCVVRIYIVVEKSTDHAKAATITNLKAKTVINFVKKPATVANGSSGRNENKTKQKIQQTNNNLRKN